MRQSIDLKAREQAISDAKQKAEAQANELGVKLGKVVTVDEIQGFGEIIPLEATTVSDSKAALHPGQQELRIQLSVKFEIK